MIANSNKSSELSGSPTASALPTRLITYAWGEQYVDILLSLTIPALLASGNLPYVAASTSCELVILTEERFFPAVAAHPSVIRAKQLCFVRLMALDDLIAAKDKYGMALTHALHRGFSDLGPAMTESWQLFLNADFVLAEGSLRSVISRLAQGERLVASPSYCVDAFAVIPDLRERVRTSGGILSIPPRELAALAMANRHNTIRGKTINQSEFTLRYMDQFYWLLDDSTLLGHQMPIAIVGMRPERHVIEPNSYWDHGLMTEYCPQAQICVLGDSDEFLMIELREKDVAQEHIEAGRPPPKFIAERMVTFLTPYQRNCAHFELTLHSREVPQEAMIARHTLRAYVDEVLSHLPAFLPSHIDHPQWNYHRPGFVEFRHKFLSARLGALTEALAPPAFSSELDSAWWKLDGMEKRAAHRRAELRGFVDRELRILQKAANNLDHPLDPASAAARANFESELAAIRNRLAPQRFAIARELDKYFNRESLALIGSGLVHLERPSSQPRNQQCSGSGGEGLQEYGRQVNAVARDLSELYDLGMQLIELELEKPRNAYRLLMPRRIESAVVPFVRTEEMSGAEPRPGSVFRRILRALLRQPLRRGLGLDPLINIVSGAARNGASRVLRVGSASGLTGSVVDRVQGSHVWVSTTGMRTGHFGRAFAAVPEFDLCICDLDFAELLEFASLVVAIRPFIAERVTIIGYHCNLELTRLPPDSVLTADLPHKNTVRIYRSGSPGIALLLQRLNRARHLYRVRDYRAFSMSLMKSVPLISIYLISAPIALLRSGYKLPRRQNPTVADDLKQSMVIEIVITKEGEAKPRQLSGTAAH